MSNNAAQDPRRGMDCRLLPHGGYTLLPAALSTMAWIAALAQDGCDYSHLTGPTVRSLTGSNVVPYLEVGFNAFRSPKYEANTDSWTVDYTSHCTEYGDIVTPDGFWKAAKGFAFLSLVFGGGGALFLWFSSCFVFSPGTWRWAGYEVLIAAVLRCLSFLWFRTELCGMDGNNCQMFFGSKSDVAAAVFWMAAAVTIFCRYPEPEKKEGSTRSGRNAPSVEMPESSMSAAPPILYEDLELPVAGDADVAMTGPSASNSAPTRPDLALPVTEADLPLAGEKNVTMELAGKKNDDKTGTSYDQANVAASASTGHAGGTIDPETARIPDAEIS